MAYTGGSERLRACGKGWVGWDALLWWGSVPLTCLGATRLCLFSSPKLLQAPDKRRTLSPHPLGRGASARRDKRVNE